MEEQIKKLVELVKEKHPERVLLQIPEGLRLKAIRIAQALENQGIETAISAEPCYGACDLREPNKVQCDMLVHIGHSKMNNTSYNTIYFPWEIEVTQELGGIDFSVIKEKKIGLLSTVQHLKMLDDVSDLLKKAGKEPVIGGQILGCNTENADKLDVDAFLVIGSGQFHALGVKGKVYVLDLEKRSITLTDPTLMEKKRYARIGKARDAKSFGILVSTKPGQMNMDQAIRIKKQLEERDKKAFILIMDNITEDKLLGIKLDAFINTACPRLSDDLKITVINASDLDKLFE